MKRVPVNLLVATAAVVAWADDEPEVRTSWLSRCVARHADADWGELDPDDVELNDKALLNRRGRILSRYPVPALLRNSTDEEAVWIITDDLADPDSPTTVLWPSDY
jgi:hypothetical protein